jgi:hypothetical protein
MDWNRTVTDTMLGGTVMMTRAELVTLERSLRDKMVLSAYVDGELRDPAKRRRWRLELRHALDAIAKKLSQASHAEREAFARCRRQLEERLAAYTGAIRAPGWAGFVTEGGVAYGEAVPVPVPTLATWGRHALVVPYVRALKEATPVLVAVMDHRKARVFRYVGHAVEKLETFRAHVPVEPPQHMGRPPRPGFHTGTRGSTGTDEAQRELREGTNRMLAELASYLEQQAGNDAWVVVGGIPVVAEALLERLPRGLRERATHVPSMDVHDRQARIAEYAREAASQMRSALDMKKVQEALESVNGNRRGVQGARATLRALHEGRVHELYFTLKYLESHPAEADEAVRLAFDSGAHVEHVSGPAAELLDAAGGIAGRLRYPEPLLAQLPEEGQLADSTAQSPSAS